jgi:integrase
MLMTWGEATSRWVKELRAGDISEGTITTRRSHLRRWARVCKHPTSATRDALIEWLAAGVWAPETKRSARQSLMSFYRFMHEAGLMDENPAAKLPRVRVPPACARPAPEDAIRAAIERASPRVRMMIMLGAIAGLRRAEIAQVHTDDLEGDDLTVLGKGGKVRVLSLPPLLARAIRAYPPGYLFPGRYQHAHTHLTGAYCGKLVKRALRGRYTTHQLRHACATELHAQGLPLLELRDHLGHASVATTQIYVRVRRVRAQQEMSALAERLAG